MHSGSAPLQPIQKSVNRASPIITGSPDSSIMKAIKASPLAKKMARDANIDLTSINGSGPGGRVVRKDIETALSKSSTSVTAVQMSGPVISHDDESVTPTKLRQAISRRMTESKTTAPHFYVSHEYKMDAVMELRKQINEFLPENEKISVNDFIVKAAALTLREFPNLNASFAGDKILRHGAVNVGVAVAVDNGLADRG